MQNNSHITVDVIDSVSNFLGHQIDMLIQVRIYQYPWIEHANVDDSSFNLSSFICDNEIVLSNDLLKRIQDGGSTFVDLTGVPTSRDASAIRL